jgi:hypothetical protein
MDHGKCDRSMIRRDDGSPGFAGDLFLGTVGVDDDEIAIDSPHDKIASICGTRENNAEQEKKDDT